MAYEKGRMIGMVRAVVTCGLLMVFGGLPLAAQRAAVSSGDGGGRTAASAGGEIRIAEREGEIEIDGRLEDNGWAGAAIITDFVQGEPVEGARAERRTEVRILFDSDAIYVGARLFESDPERIARQLVRRDETGQADYFDVLFDPNLDRRTGYRFRLTAAGVQSDAYLYQDNREDDSWDAVWESDVAIDAKGWTLEMRIPWSQIRYATGTRAQEWGVNFARWRVAAGERSYYALVPRSQHGRVSFSRTMSGVQVPDRVQRIELRPYALARGHTGPVRPGDPFFDGADAAAQFGADVRYGLGSAFTLDATVNPDFGQVELDPAVINLSAFETFFPEKRPFFVEDARILDFSLSGGRNSLFYSRRIGREPQGPRPRGATHTDVPDQSTILGAGKLTGRTAGGLSVGVLAAMTAAEEADALFAGSGASGDSIAGYLVEPRGYYGVSRVQQDLRGGATTVGGIVTGMRRDLPSDGSFDFLPSDAYSVGLDFEHMWGDREWALEGFWAGSLVRGRPASIVRIQTSSNHYFQRPDSGFRVDSAAASMVGAEWRLQFSRRSGTHWTGAVWAAEVTPGFEVNDLGYSRSTERLDGGARISYREIRPGPLFRDYNITAWTYHNWRHEALDRALSPGSWAHAHKAGALSLNARGTLNSFWGGSARVTYSPEVLDDGATRGGPLMVDPASIGTQLELHTDRRDAVTFNTSMNYSRGDGGHSVRGGIGVRFRPSPGWELQLEPSASRARTTGQYVAVFDDPEFTSTYGRRYLFGELDRTSVGLETRVNATFTPALTLQLFAQPLIEAGQYTTYKQLSRAETYDFAAFTPGMAVDADGDGVVDRCDGGTICGLDGKQFVDLDGDGVLSASHLFRDRDFNLVSLRGNAVLRWEYRPGSTVFLVWQQRRADYRSFGDFDFDRDRSDLLGLQPDNIFIVKLNYWMNL